MFAGQTITGGWLSRTVTVKLHAAVLPAASLTTNVLVVTPTGNNEPLARPAVWTVLEPGHLSVPTGAVYPTRRSSALVSLFWVMFAGQTITGGCASVTVTVKLHAAVLPAASLTTNVLVVTPTGNNEPLARPAVWTVLEPGQLSVPTGAV